MAEKGNPHSRRGKRAPTPRTAGLARKRANLRKEGEVFRDLDERGVGLLERAVLRKLKGRAKLNAWGMVMEHCTEEAAAVIGARLTTQTVEATSALEQRLTEIHARHIEFLKDLGLRNTELAVRGIDELQQLICRLLDKAQELTENLPESLSESRQKRMQKDLRNVIEGWYEQVFRKLTGDFAEEGFAPGEHAASLAEELIDAKMLASLRASIETINRNLDDTQAALANIDQKLGDLS